MTTDPTAQPTPTPAPVAAPEGGWLTDDEWRDFQAIPDQGYSHRSWVNDRITERVAEAVHAPREDAPRPEPTPEKVHVGVERDTEMGGVSCSECGWHLAGRDTLEAGVMEERQRQHDEHHAPRPEPVTATRGLCDVRGPSLVRPGLGSFPLVCRFPHGHGGDHESEDGGRWWGEWPPRHPESVGGASDTQEALRRLLERGVGTDLTPTVSPTVDIAWWYDYLRRLDERWRSEVKRVAEIMTLEQSEPVTAPLPSEAVRAAADAVIRTIGDDPASYSDEDREASIEVATAALTAAGYTLPADRRARDEGTVREVVVRLPLDAVLTGWTNGDDTGWHQEFAHLEAEHADRLDALTTSIQQAGMQEPIHLGADGRVWDGHHRLCVANRLALETVPVRIHADGGS